MLSENDLSWLNSIKIHTNDNVGTLNRNIWAHCRQWSYYCAACLLSSWLACQWHGKRTTVTLNYLLLYGLRWSDTNQPDQKIVMVSYSFSMPKRAMRPHANVFTRNKHFGFWSTMSETTIDNHLYEVFQLVGVVKLLIIWKDSIDEWEFQHNHN